MLGILHVFHKLLKYWQLFIVPLLYLHELNYDLSRALQAFIYNFWIFITFGNPFFSYVVSSCKHSNKNIWGNFSFDDSTTVKHLLKPRWTELSSFTLYIWNVSALSDYQINRRIFILLSINRFLARHACKNCTCNQAFRLI